MLQSAPLLKGKDRGLILALAPLTLVISLLSCTAAFKWWKKRSWLHDSDDASSLTGWDASTQDSGKRPSSAPRNATKAPTKSSKAKSSMIGAGVGLTSSRRPKFEKIQTHEEHNIATLADPEALHAMNFAGIELAQLPIDTLSDMQDEGNQAAMRSVIANKLHRQMVQDFDASRPAPVLVAKGKKVAEKGKNVSAPRAPSAFRTLGDLPQPPIAAVRDALKPSGNTPRRAMSTATSCLDFNLPLPSEAGDVLKTNVATRAPKDLD